MDTDWLREHEVSKSPSLFISLGTTDRSMLRYTIKNIVYLINSYKKRIEESDDLIG